MIPLINWLNSYWSVTTHFCCQGEPRKEDEPEELYSINRPYIVFTCLDSVDLVSVLSIIGYHATVEVGWNEYKSCIEYIIRFYDQDKMFDTINYLKMRDAQVILRMKR